MTVVDVGANVGAHTLPLALAVGSTGRIVAVEPTAAAFNRLCRNRNLNPELAARIVPVHAALGAPGGSLQPAYYSAWPLEAVEDGGYFHPVHLGAERSTANAPFCVPRRSRRHDGLRRGRPRQDRRRRQRTGGARGRPGRDPPGSPDGPLRAVSLPAHGDRTIGQRPRDVLHITGATSCSTNERCARSEPTRRASSRPCRRWAGETLSPASRMRREGPGGQITLPVSWSQKFADIFPAGIMRFAHLCPINSLSGAGRVVGRD